MKMKIVSWNVNGLRSVFKKGFLEWFASESADIVCLQEIKVMPDQLTKSEELLHPHGYNSFWNSAEKPGYSGVVIYSRRDPDEIREGLGVSEFDREGRWLEADFGEVTLITSYFPNSQRDHARLGFKIDFCQSAEERLAALRSQGRATVICGDFNIAHKEVDLKNPKSNMQNAGFLPEERAWMDGFVSKGWVDTFRVFEKGPDHYTWWSYRPGVRERNIGWRLDYFFINQESVERLQAVKHASEVRGSDHCPVRLVMKV